MVICCSSSTEDNSLAVLVLLVCAVGSDDASTSCVLLSELAMLCMRVVLTGGVISSGVSVVIGMRTVDGSFEVCSLVKVDDNDGVEV